MTIRTATATGLTTAAMLAAAVFAEPHDEHGHAVADAHGAAGHAAYTPEVVPPIEQGLVPLIVAVVVFTVLLLVLSVAVWPKIVQGIKDRENKVRAENESAEAARRDAKEALEEYQRSLANARAEAQKMLEQARQQQAVLSAELHAKADAELNALRDRARQDIEAAKRAALADVHAMAGELGMTIAGKVLRRPVQVGNAKAVLEESLTQLAGSR